MEEVMPWCIGSTRQLSASVVLNIAIVFLISTMRQRAALTGTSQVACVEQERPNLGAMLSKDQLSSKRFS